MSEARRYTARDGSFLRIDRIQLIDTDPLAEGVTGVFNVEPQEAPGGAAAAGFEIEIYVAPIFVHLLPEAGRMTISDTLVTVVERVLDVDVRESVHARVSSDGAVVLHGRVIGRLLPLAKPA